MNASSTGAFAHGTPDGGPERALVPGPVPGPVPGTVRARVLAARRTVAAVRATESLFLATAAGLATAAAALLSGAAAGHPHAVGAALISAVACGLTWWLETRPDAHEIARRIDRRLVLRGALTTAFELEAGTPRGRRPAGAEGALAGLLCARVAARVSQRSALQAVLPSSAAVLALPFVAAALLALARRAAEPSAPAVDLSAIVEGLGDRASALSRAVGQDLAAGLLTPDQARALAELVSRTRSFEADFARGGQPPERTADELERLRRDLDLAAAAVPRGSQSAQRAGEAGLWADAARDAARGLDPRATEQRGIPAGDPRAESAPDVSSAPTTGPGSTAGEGGSAGRGEAGVGKPLTAGAGRGTMSGSHDGAGHVSDASDSAAAHESGVIAGRTWPAHHDALVARWVEARRVAAAHDQAPASDPPQDR